MLLVIPAFIAGSDGVYGSCIFFSRVSRDVGRKIGGCRNGDVPQTQMKLISLDTSRLHFDDLASHVLGNSLVTFKLLCIFYYQLFGSVLSTIVLSWLTSHSAQLRDKCDNNANNAKRHSLC
jgi:hypothetical protein